jgi:predicted ATPase
MFEAVRVLIERASSRLPVAILIDDVHWADRGTLALLHYVVRGLTRRRCLFLVTYRADEASDELRELLSALQRAETLTVVELAGLEAAEVKDLAEASQGTLYVAELFEQADDKNGKAGHAASVIMTTRLAEAPCQRLLLGAANRGVL